jgi:hypothetical protein
MNDTELLAELLADRTEEEISAAVRRVQVRKLSELLHTLLCPLDHEKDCDFYFPEVSIKKSQSRMEWFWRTDRLLKNAEINEDEIDLIIMRLPSAIHAVTSSLPILRFLSKILPMFQQQASAREEIQASRQEVPSSCPVGPEGFVLPSEP